MGPTEAGSAAEVPEGVPANECVGECDGAPTDELTERIRARGASARECYEQQLQKNPKLFGSLHVALHVEPNGRVCSRKIERIDFPESPELMACIDGLFADLHLPPPRGGCLLVVLPLNFTIKEEERTGTPTP